jgi:hypothetical protein
MDPYLEAFWPDVHATLITHSRSLIQRQLGGSGLIARVEERLIVESPFERPHSRRGDVVLSDVDPRTVDRLTTRGGEGAVAVAEPIVVPAEAMPQRSIAITDGLGGEVVTVIEFVSPSNKLAGDGREQYLRKQYECVHANVNLVEIDLVRAGRRVVHYPEERMTPEMRATYLICTFRAVGDKRYEIYPIRLDQKLPTIRIPLRYNDADVTLDLQAALNQTYEDGAYDRIDYARPCAPPLVGPDLEIASRLLTRP